MSLHVARQKTAMKLGLRWKLLMLITSLAISLVFAEFALRFAGFLMRAHHNEIADGAGKEDEFTILCLGDSFTHGGASPAGKTYPAYLQRFTDMASNSCASNGTKPCLKIKVVNGGVCAINTEELVEYLPEWIEKVNPDLIVLLAGAADRFNNFDYELRKMGGFASIAGGWLIDLRIVRMTYMIWLERRAASIASNKQSFGNRLLKLSTEITELQANGDSPKSDRRKSRRLIWKADNSRSKYMFGAATEYYLQSFQFAPDNSEIYYWLDKTAALQSNVAYMDIYSVFNRIAKMNPNLAADENFAQYLRRFREKMDWEKGISGWSESNLERVVEICATKGVDLMLQTYPTDYPLANNLAIRLARKYSLPIVNNFAQFSKLEFGGANILDDQHCTESGHKLMAKNVFVVLRERFGQTLFE